MARIPEAEIERVKATVDLAALVRSRGVELRKHGARDLVGRCPFHEEQTASFVVSPHKRLFHCLGCGADIRARLTRLGVVNPFAHLLTFTAGRTRTIITKEVNKRVVEFIEVQLADIEAANSLAPEILGRSLDELPPQTRRLLNSIRELLKAKIEEAGQPQSRLHFSRREVCERSGWTYAQVRTHLERLIAVELVATRAGRNGALMLYELLADAGAPETAWPIGLI